MNMSEFERSKDDAEETLCHNLSQKDLIPADFSQDEIAFAHELGSLFPAEEEMLPPYFVQTLMDTDGPRFQPARDDFEQRTYVHVFRRLKLRRRLFHTSHTRWQPEETHRNLLRRPLIALATACILFMVVTMLATSNSFAAGLLYLFSGPHSGVMQYQQYPNELSVMHQQVHRPASTHGSPRLNLLLVQRLLHFPIYWPSMPDNYILNHVSLYRGPTQSWQLIDGPILKFVYVFSHQGEKAKGTGQIIVWEFKPLGRVLQGVQMGAAHQVQISPGGQAGLVVNGQWVKIDRTTHKWVYDGSGELIYERNGVIFWIQGDQNDGINQQALVDIATSLKIFDTHRLISLNTPVDDVTQQDDPSWFIAGIHDADTPGGPSLIVVGPEQPQIPYQKGMMRLP